MKLTKEEHDKINLRLSILAGFLQDFSYAFLEQALEDYRDAGAGSTAYMAIVDRPFQWLDSVNAKTKILEALLQLKKELLVMETKNQRQE